MNSDWVIRKQTIETKTYTAKTTNAKTLFEKSIAGSNQDILSFFLREQFFYDYFLISVDFTGIENRFDDTCWERENGFNSS